MKSKDQAKLYYLYMISDGEITDNEKRMFNLICKELYLDGVEKEAVIKECKEIVSKEELNCLEVIELNVRKGYMHGVIGIDMNKYDSMCEKATIIWNLINLGYADKDFSNNEEEVVEYLCEYWDINDLIYNEMRDVADTIGMLEKHKSFVEASMQESEIKKAKLKKIRDDIKYVQSTIKTTLAELDT